MKKARRTMLQTKIDELKIQIDLEIGEYKKAMQKFMTEDEYRAVFTAAADSLHGRWQQLIALLYELYVDNC